EEVVKFGRRSLERQVDVGERKALEMAVAEVLDAWGRIDVVVCNAGGGLGTAETSLASSLDPDAFEAVLRRNLYGTVNTCRTAAPTMKAQGSGKIITVSSQAGRRGSATGGYAHYGV